MAKRTVTITMVIETDDYDDELVTPDQVLDLARDIVDSNANWPDKLVLACEGMTREVEP